MKRFVNSQSKTYHHSSIENFSDTNKFLSGGLVRGNNVVEHSWVADMLFKNTGNLSLNPHAGYISFFSDRDIMHQEFGNVESIQSAYPFFSYLERFIFPDNTFELNTKQYFKVSQQHAEFDLIEYINPSEFITEPVNGYSIQHEFYRAPAFHAEGYKLNMDDDGHESFDKYLWSSKNKGFTTFNLGEYVLTLILYSGAVSSELSSDNYLIYNSHSGVSERILDYKIHADNPKYKYFESGLSQWIFYYNESEHYQGGSFYPYVGSVGVYLGEDWAENIPKKGSNFTFYPQVIIDGKLEPAKIIWIPDTGAYSTKGRMLFNPGNHLNDSNDQSRIVYSVCNSMVNGSSEEYFVRRSFTGGEYINGIDIDTERNRRYSAVVMTEPYFVVVPLGSGQLVEYSFIDENGSEPTDSTDKRYLKIKASLNIFSEIDNELNSNDYNSDIINVLTINDIPTNAYLISGGTFYTGFKGNDSIFYGRQNACLDDFICSLYNGVVGDGKHITFWIAPFGVDVAKYSDGKMKVCGLGVTWDGSGLNSRMNLNIYCTNYNAINSPPPGTVETPVANDYLEFVDSSHINVYSGSEKFKPMIKLPGMNGYVKIMSKNTNFKVTRASDGKYEIVYNVEFPYCPGSETVRSATSGLFGSISGFIYKKKSYINAGSQEADAVNNDRYDSGNNRYAPYGDDSFSAVEILLNPSSPESFVTTDPFDSGGGKEISLNSLKSTVKNRINYPKDLVWYSDITHINLFSLIKPRFENFRRYGTYEIGFDGVFGSGGDMKLFCLVDNRQWKFNEDKFLSYIGNENPSYIFKIDVSVLFEDFTKYQSHHGAIPDVKRWLYSYFAGFAHTVLSKDLEDSNVNTEKLSTMGNNSDIISSDSKSDITIEIWDQRSDLGNSQQGNWRPFISLGSDNHKIPDSIIVDNIFISDVSSVVGGYPENEFEDIYSVYIKYMEIDENGILSFTFPQNVVSESDEVDVLDGQSNLILYDKEDRVSLHIAYMKRVNDPLSISSTQKIYKAYVKSTTGSGIFKLIDVENISEDDISQYQIRKPLKTLAKNPRFSTPTVKAVDGVDAGFLTKFLDLRGEGSLSDYDRFVVDNEIHFRIRPIRGKKYPPSYYSGDVSEIPYLGSGVGDDSDLNRDELNFPWYASTGIVGDAFDWAKIKTEETIRKFGLNYFKCASK